MKKKVLVLFFILCFVYGCNYFMSEEQKEISESPEKIFNLANEAMVKGKKDIAIELYYKIIENYPDFKKYRADVLYRLGMLLFKSERYEESEKILWQLATKYKNYPRIKKVYEKLIYIYIQELPDPTRAKKIKNIYRSRFKTDEKFEKIEKTFVLLNSKVEKENLLKLDSSELWVTNIGKIDRYDREFFPVECFLELKVFSPDRKLLAERKKTNDQYFLYLTDVNQNKTWKIINSENGFGHQWSWDSRFIVFTVMNWATKERQIRLYSVKDNKTKILFTGKNIGDILCFSPDNSKIAFWYYNELWLIDRTGKNMSLINKKMKGNDVVLMAWSRDGDRILVGKQISDKLHYYMLELGRKEYTLTK